MNSIYPLNENDPDHDSGVQVTLGLQREPFSPEPAVKDYFYAEQTRSQRLKLLHHLAPYGELLIVTGEPGSGKTTLLQQFVERAHDTWRLCVVTAHQQLDQDQLLDALMEGFGIQAQPGDGDMEKLQRLKSHCVALKRKSLLPMVVIDDAHLLGAGALGALMQLFQALDSHEKPLQIVLFAAPQLREAISIPELEALQERISHTFNLPPFSEKETANYIQHRLKVAGVGGQELFTETVVAMIHKTSQGQPAKINELAKVVLANKAGGGASLQSQPDAKGGRDAKGWKGFIPLGLALSILILVVLYLLHSVNTPPSGGVTEQAPIARNGDQETVPLSLPNNTAPAAPTDSGSGLQDQGAPFADQGAMAPGRDELAGPAGDTPPAPEAAVPSPAPSLPPGADAPPEQAAAPKPAAAPPPTPGRRRRAGARGFPPGSARRVCPAQAGPRQGGQGRPDRRRQGGRRGQGRQVGAGPGPAPLHHAGHGHPYARRHRPVHPPPRSRCRRLCPIPEGQRWQALACASLRPLCLPPAGRSQGQAPAGRPARRQAVDSPPGRCPGRHPPVSEDSPVSDPHPG